MTDWKNFSGESVHVIANPIRLGLIQQYILPGSIIHSDSAAMYVNLHTDPPSSQIASIPVPIPYAPYQHLWVNHRENLLTH